jgi:hypothetical protein
MYRQRQNYDDGESLQADVMRFMAIIAFCLIAILALVKHAEPSQTENAVDSTPEPLPAAEPKPATEEIQLASIPVAPVAPVTPVTVKAERVIPKERVIPEMAPEREVEPQPVLQAELEPELDPEQPVASVPPVTSSKPAPEPPEPTLAEPPLPEAATPEADTPEEDSLILRFASDGDFLRLIARGDIRVYAFQESDVLTLSESYRFLDTQSPGQVYELLPPSIPTLIVDALKQARSDIDGYRWGIALPGHISNQIERHLGQVSQGQLVIDRYGDVHHVAAS